MSLKEVLEASAQQARAEAVVGMERAERLAADAADDWAEEREDS